MSSSGVGGSKCLSTAFLSLLFVGILAPSPSPGASTSYRFDALNRPIWKQSPSGAIEEYEYDDVGNLITIRRSNGTVTTQEYNNMNRLEKKETVYRGNVLSSYAYTYDLAGHKTSVLEGHTGRKVEYEYDDVYRLTEERIFQPGEPTRIISYTYDAVGNRLSKTDTVEGLTAYEYDDNDRLIEETGPAGTTTYGWDDAGRNTSVSGAGRSETHTFDAEDRMLSATSDGDTTNFEYDHKGIKTASIKDGVRTEYLVDSVSVPHAQVIEEIQDGEVKKRFDYNAATAKPSAVTDATGTHPLLADGQGSVRIMTDDAGQVEGTQDFDAFGVKLGAQGIEIPRGYAGEETFPQAGLVYLRARWMDPGVARFLSRDPFYGTILNPASMHSFNYAGSDPINKVDPSGCFFNIPSLLLLVSTFGIIDDPDARNPFDPPSLRSGTNRVMRVRFDDAPIGGTKTVLGVLGPPRNIKATFLIIGVHAKNFPIIAQNIADAGHVIANHSYSHWLDYDAHTEQEYAADFVRARNEVPVLSDAVLAGLPGQKPSGKQSYADAVQGKGFVLLGWNEVIKPEDSNKTAEHVVEKILRTQGLVPIILFHDSDWQGKASKLGKVFDLLKEKRVKIRAVEGP